MTPTWLPLVVGFTGALIGGAALLTVYFLTRQEGRRQQRLDVRREAYAELLAATHHFATTTFGVRSGKTEQSELLQATRDLLAANAMVRLVGPEATGRSARVIVDKLLANLAASVPAPSAGVATTPASPSMGAELTEFMTLAKRDLSLEEPARRRRLASKRGLGWLDRERSRESASQD